MRKDAIRSQGADTILVPMVTAAIKETITTLRTEERMTISTNEMKRYEHGMPKKE